MTELTRTLRKCMSDGLRNLQEPWGGWRRMRENEEEGRS